MSYFRAHKIIYIFFLSIPFLLPSFGQPTSSQQDLSEYEKRLIAITEQITGIRKKISEEEKRKTSVLSRLNTIGLNKTLIKKEISLYNTQMQKADKELITFQKNIPVLEEKLQKEKQSIEKILVTLYKFGKFSYLDFLFQVEDVSHLISESKNLSLLAQSQNRIIADYLKTLSDLQASRESLEIKKQEISQLIQKAKEKRQDYSGQEKKYQSLIQEIDRNKETHLKTLEELKDRAEQLQNLVKKLQREEISLPYTLIPLYEKKGNLAWPLVGRIVTRFGPSRHRQFNTLTQNNGIEISPQKDTVVKAIHAGRVAYTDYFEGYGYLVIIDHGMTYYSLYGHLSSEFLVKKGDFVKDGQPIATVGEFGSLKEETLYFEIRYKTDPVNPLQWLKRR
ncbi:MAG: peptidoglycan DD-metalloendopeptidase family protein [Candidatus Aminicenantes bacterium]|nr:MAG: peptidoglycan DD-metalloendopeptidase family protein [Candidatus Aminicenantes bacterium]